MYSYDKVLVMFLSFNIKLITTELTLSYDITQIVYNLSKVVFLTVNATGKLKNLCWKLRKMTECGYI